MRIWENFGIDGDWILVTGTVEVCGYKNLRVFNFAILLDSRNSRKIKYTRKFSVLQYLLYFFKI